MLLKNVLLIGFAIFSLQFFGTKVDFSNYRIFNSTKMEKPEATEKTKAAALFSSEEPNNFFADNGVCWRESYGRGAGTIPGGCPPGYENDAGLCYKKCKTGYKGVGPVCWQTCPSGYRDDGAYCNKPGNGKAYGRGVGFPWKFGDALNLDAAMKRCEAKHGRGNCEKCLEIIYPKCKKGYRAVGCNICTSECPDGMRDNGVSCHKNSYGRGVGTIPRLCPNGQENQGGLCYKLCKNGMKGIGPVCWDVDCPDNFPVQCGASCAETKKDCIQSVFDQVTTPLELVITVAEVALTAGTVTAIKTGVKTAAKTGAKVAAKKAAKKVAAKVTKASAKKALKKSAKEYGKYLSEAAATEAAEMMVDASLQAAVYKEVHGLDVDWDDLAIMDPTGISNIVLAYANPLCRDVKGPARKKPTPKQPKGFDAHVPDKPNIKDGPNRVPISKLKGKYVTIDNGKYRFHCDHIHRIIPLYEGSHSGMWVIEPVSGKSGLYTIKNKWKNGRKMRMLKTARVPGSNMRDAYTLEFVSNEDSYCHFYFKKAGKNAYLIINKGIEDSGKGGMLYRTNNGKIGTKQVTNIDGNAFWNINLVK